MGLALQKSWLTSNAYIVGYMDLDLATELSHIKQVVEIFCHTESQLIYGTRLHKNSEVINRTLKREVISRIFNFLLKMYFSTKFSDGMCGFKFLKRESALEVISKGNKNPGWFFCTEILIIAEKLNLQMYELPVKWTDDINSKVKIISLSLEYLRAMRKLKKMLKDVCLGTAMWGWSVNKLEAFKILDTYYDSGSRFIDTAFNYPINSDINDLSYASNIISEWIKINKIDDLKIIFKFGSINNSKTSLCDLSNSNVQKMAEFSSVMFGDNIYSLMIHWDNRNVRSEIETTLTKLVSITTNNNIRLGLSGIKKSEKYETSLKNIDVKCLDHQLKHSFLDKDLNTLNIPFAEDYRVWAYGICGSGLKLNEAEYRKDSYVSLVRDVGFHRRSFPHSVQKNIAKFISDHDLVNNLYEYSMLIKERDSRFFGYLISPSSNSQMQQIISFRKKLCS